MEGNAPPGWNDPPKYVPPPTGNLKINLNKRVAFPLSKPPTDPNAATSSPSNMPPLELPPAIPALIPTLPTSTEISQSNDESFDSQAEFDKVTEIFDKVLSQSNSAVQSSVNAKLQSLKDEWSSYDKNLLKLIVEFAEFIKANDSKNAAGVQRKIVMSGCNKQWLHGIRQIISIIESNVNDTEHSSSNIE